MIKETQITKDLVLIELDDAIHIGIKIENMPIVNTALNPIEAIHLRNNISIWANNKRNRDLRKEKKS